MKRSNWVRLLAVILVISLMVGPVSAVTFRSGEGNRQNALVGSLIGRIRDIVRDIIDDWFDQPFPGKPISPKPTTPVDPSEPVDNTDPTGPVDSTDPTDPEDPESTNSGLELVEGYSNTENGQLLRGHTYKLSEVISQQKPQNPISHIGLRKPISILPGNPIGGLRINAVTTTDAEATKTLVEVTSADSFAAGKQYIIVNERRTEYNEQHGLLTTNPYTATISWSGLKITGLNIAYAVSDDTTELWTITPDGNGGYAIMHGEKYLTLDHNSSANTSTAGLTDTATYLKLEKNTHAYCWFIRNAENEYLSNVGRGSNYTGASGFNEDGGSHWKIYEVVTEVTEPEQPAVDPSDASRDIPVEHLTVTAGSAETDSGSNGPEMVLDGVNDTIWHTEWDGTSNRTLHWIQFELSGDCTVDGMRVLPRQDLNKINGIITSYEIQISSDGNNFTKVTEGTWTYDGRPWKIATFDAVNAKYVRLVVKNAMSENDKLFASAAEIRLTGEYTGPTEPEEPEQPTIPEGSYAVYFPVTMFNYTEATINAATDAKDPDGTTVRDGLYFSNGSPDSRKTTTTDLSAFVEGQYYIQNVRASSNNVASWLQAHPDNKIHGVEKSAATIWTLVVEDGTYYLTCEIDGETNYMKVGTNGNNDGYTTDKTPVTLSGVNGNANAVKIGSGNYFLCQWGSPTAPDYGGYGDNDNDPGNAMLFYPVDSDTPIAPGKTETKITSGYQEWNRWDKTSGDNSNGDLFYTGLVEKELVKDQLVFTVPDGGIFNNDTAVKDIYNFVGMPFLLNTTTGVYSFDSENNGAYFAGEPQSGTATEPHNLHFAYGAAQPMPHDVNVGDSSVNAFLPFNNKWTPLENGRGQYGDWIDYHFGMRADLPFSMTPNGCVKSTDDKSDHITFTFSGDDDAWIFIDGKLVADLGGIHNRLDVTLDFAANTVTYSEENSQDGNNNTSSYNDPTFATTQKLFNEGGETGLLGMTRVEFASDESHEMQFFYLERGKGTSNCRIEFNLPMRDTLLVTKNATMSWSADQDANDGDKDGTQELTEREQAVVDNIPFGFTLYKMDGAYLDDTGAPIDGFSLNDFTPVARTNYFVQDKDGNIIGDGSTDANGRFYLKNGQTAKFMTDMPGTGVTYFLVEDQTPEGFLTPDYKYAGTATKGFSYNGSRLKPGTDEVESVQNHVSDATQMGEHELPIVEGDGTQTNRSYIITVKGSIEASDSLEFICVNYVDERLPKPSAFANEDIIVIDYGLPVQIDPLANDVFRGEDVEIVAWGDESLKLNEVLSGSFADEDKTNWSGNKVFTDATSEAQVFDSGLVTFKDKTYAETPKTVTNEDGSTTTTYEYTRDTFEYKLTKQLTEVEELYYIIKVTAKDDEDTTKTNSRYSLGKVYIVPATIMYYEENFSDMITFEGTGWSDASDPQNISNAANISDFQEPGVVGTVDDSTYGSDVAYLSDNGDSNGTMRHADTTKGAVRFSYTFTGTGTTIFARTSATTGYMQVKIYAIDENGKATLQNITYRDTYWKDQNENNLDGTGTLYNIPVFSEEFQHYGTYKVVCTVAMKGTPTEGNKAGAGNEFYLDGIRVMQPLKGVFAIDESGKDYEIPVDQMDSLTAKGVGAYKTDGESNLEVATLRQKLITDAQAGGTDWNDKNFAVLTDTNGNIVTASEYISIGPKEEVYLSADNNNTNAQTVSFSLETWKPEGLKLYMGMKAPFGHAVINVGDHAVELKNAPDCYYDVTNYGSVTEMTDEKGNTYHVITFTFEAAESIVSLTNIKIVGSYEIHLPEDTDILVEGFEGGNYEVGN